MKGTWSKRNKIRRRGGSAKEAIREHCEGRGKEPPSSMPVGQMGRKGRGTRTTRNQSAHHHERGHEKLEEKGGTVRKKNHKSPQVGLTESLKKSRPLVKNPGKTASAECQSIKESRKRNQGQKYLQKNN